MSLHMPQQPLIQVGISFTPEIHFRLNGSYRLENTSTFLSGEYFLQKENEGYKLCNRQSEKIVELPLQLNPQQSDACSFTLTDVVIGIGFHWERKEDQTFKGALRIITEDDHLTAINLLSIEEYLVSVISSEMSATSSLELLKAHAVISRSWLLAQKEKSRHIRPNYRSCYRTDEEYLRWYDREDHAHFDVCADDHCQRYQGISKASTAAVQEAVISTSGEVLTWQGKICDTRFSKCCGGVTEYFENTWEPEPHPYLSSIADRPDAAPVGDLRLEENARAWILSSPAAFCNTTDRQILSEVLNDYDQETHHFYRWKVAYDIGELSKLVKQKLGIDFGMIEEITPIERGASGRLIRVKICGSLRSLIIGKELVIRKAFSPSHLYSSAFVVEKTDGRFVFYGAGWGHGVGLCQIGAAVMAAQGYNYREILQHYFTSSVLEKIYE